MTHSTSSGREGLWMLPAHGRLYFLYPQLSIASKRAFTATGRQRQSFRDRYEAVRQGNRQAAEALPLTYSQTPSSGRSEGSRDDRHSKTPFRHDNLRSTPVSDTTRTSSRVSRPVSGPLSQEGTMTNREKELFSKIFQSILSKKPSMQEERRDETISFTKSSAGTEAPQRSSVLDEDYMTQFPALVQQELVAAHIQVKSREARIEANRARTLPQYLEHKQKLYAFKDMSLLMDYVEEQLFGPFVRGEIVLERPTPEILDFCRAYPLLLADVMCILRLSFRDVSSTIAIFERMKEIGIESRAIGGNAVVYNELLLARFEGWHDLGMIQEIMREMEQDAIEADEQTLVILKHIRSMILVERESTSGGREYWAQVRPIRLESLSKWIFQVNKALTSAQ